MTADQLLCVADEIVPQKPAAGEFSDAASPRNMLVGGFCERPVWTFGVRLSRSRRAGPLGPSIPFVSLTGANSYAFSSCHSVLQAHRKVSFLRNGCLLVHRPWEVAHGHAKSVWGCHDEALS